MECEFEYRFALRELQMKIIEVNSLLINDSNFLVDCLQLRPKTRRNRETSPLIEFTIYLCTRFCHQI